MNRSLFFFYLLTKPVPIFSLFLQLWMLVWKEVIGQSHPVSVTIPRHDLIDGEKERERERARKKGSINTCSNCLSLLQNRMVVRCDSFVPWLFEACPVSDGKSILFHLSVSDSPFATPKFEFEKSEVSPAMRLIPVSLPMEWV